MGQCNGGYSVVHEGSAWYADQRVRPYMQGGPGLYESGTPVGEPSGDSEGMFLNLLNEYRDGQGLAPAGEEEPVFTRYIEKNRIEYWFNYGNSHVLFCPGCTHEGDWEHIAIKLDSYTNKPVRVEYFYHHWSCVLPWPSVPKNSSGHPIVLVAREAHGSYPSNAADAAWSDDIMSPGTPRQWPTYRNVAPVASQSWWGYSGGWGEVGSKSDYSGPMGPSLKQKVPAFSTATDARCKTK